MGGVGAEYNGYYEFDPEKYSDMDEEHFNRYINLGITSDDMLSLLNDKNITERDLAPFKYPNLRDLKKIGYRSLKYGNHIKWDPVKRTKIIQDELGWEFDEVEGLLWFLDGKNWMSRNGTRDRLKYVKRGFGRTAQSVAREIRLGNRQKKKEKNLLMNIMQKSQRV